MMLGVEMWEFTYLFNSCAETRRIDECWSVEICVNENSLVSENERKQMDGGHWEQEEENDRGRGGETGMYHLLLKAGGVDLIKQVL